MEEKVKGKVVAKEKVAKARGCVKIYWGQGKARWSFYEVFYEERLIPCISLYISIYTQIHIIYVYHQFCLEKTRVHFAGLPVASTWLTWPLESFKASFASYSRQRKELEAQPSALRLTVVDSNATMVVVASFKILLKTREAPNTWDDQILV